jgi:hypothetical protein
MHLAGDELLAYVAGKLAAADRERVAAHLGACLSCRAALEEIRRGAGPGARAPEPAEPSTVDPLLAEPEYAKAMERWGRGPGVVAGAPAGRFLVHRFHAEGSLPVPVAPTVAPMTANLPLIPGYEILGKVGRGGMGVVYKARQLKLDRVVALKMIRGGAHVSGAALARFRAEAETVARFRHPNIVEIYAFGEHKSLPYFALEFVEGGTLAQRLNETPLPPELAANLAETLTRAIQVAHQHGIVHRDLNPANILLTSDGTPKITDFGLARRLDETGQTQTGEILGTPGYMAPEQAKGKSKDAGPAADIYALGAILYAMLTGRPPFKEATPLETIRRLVRARPVPPRRLQPRLPRDLEAICLKCLAKQPCQRYATASELAEDLRRFLAGQCIRARRKAPWPRVGKWVKRRPVMVALAAGPLMALTLLVENGLVDSVVAALAAGPLLVLGWAGYLFGPAVFHDPGLGGRPLLDRHRPRSP